jgi:hypothetical protein
MPAGDLPGLVNKVVLVLATTPVIIPRQGIIFKSNTISVWLHVFGFRVNGENGLEEPISHLKSYILIQ